CARNDGFAFW
nr:immunoglobulin heavy chain junction region [Mus musculus]MBK4188292.1 immunoglobulin heavy chain junction region [Mus musculus]MBK4188293.1 immunoglobulin heavy chain junction region [Mus musculus]MBK4188294.1 immunoglobulin heavy chain junction region [Mus musculus]MBK4188295.1 immunoglobulin heavy chain junction region [Mus musculus]